MKSLFIAIASALIGAIFTFVVTNLIDTKARDVGYLELSFKASELELLAAIAKTEKEHQACKSAFFAETTYKSLKLAQEGAFEGREGRGAKSHISRALKAYENSGLPSLLDVCKIVHGKT